MPPLGRNVYVLRSHAKTVSVRVSGGEQHMVIGFRTAAAARKVQHALHPGREIELVQTRPVRASVKFPKAQEELNSPKLDLVLAELNIEEFSSYPFTRALGIVFAVDVERENTNEISFRAMVVEAQGWVLGNDLLHVFDP